jgi:biofilm PGA synthesis protein PgaD
VRPIRNAGATVTEAGSPPRPFEARQLSAAEKALLEEAALRTRTPLIIERPEGVLSARRMTNYVLTFLWWSVWGHFMLPLMTLLLWMSGFQHFSADLMGRDGLDALVGRLPLYLTIVGILCSGLIGWALLNWWRFADRERRRSFRPVSAAMIAHNCGIEPEKLARWQTARRLVVSHDSEGRLTAAE